jgi:hypothetical protein
MWSASLLHATAISMSIALERGSDVVLACGKIKCPLTAIRLVAVQYAESCRAPSGRPAEYHLR